MNLEQLVAREIIKALSDNAHIIFKPSFTRVRQVPSGTLSKLYPLSEAVGDMGRYHPSRPPSSNVTNCAHVYDQARIFGVRTRM